MIPGYDSFPGQALRLLAGTVEYALIRLRKLTQKVGNATPVRQRGYFMKSISSLAWVLLFLLCANAQASNSVFELGEHERLVTLLGTNDIHGGIEPTLGRDGDVAGGMAQWSGIAASIRKGLANRYGDRSGVLVLDAGDQFQGTLLSNYDEGQLLFATMSEVGYDAVIPGNHDYDFGPVGWLHDKVSQETQDQNPRGALERLVSQARFPLISANTYLKSSFVDQDGDLVNVDSSGCKVLPARAGGKAEFRIDWTKVKRPEFLKPYVVKSVAGVRVALIGIDNVGTPKSTTPENVSDLCFDDEFYAYRRARRALSGQADVFVMVIHSGNTREDYSASNLVSRIVKMDTGDSANAIDAVIAGHTHFMNHTRVEGVPLIQSEDGGEKFGRIDLVWDSAARKIVPQKTRSFASIRMLTGRCEPKARDFCAPVAGGVAYEGVTVDPSAKVLDLIARARQAIAPMADRKLGNANGEITRDRIKESALANVLTDALRSLSGTDVAMMNSSGLRTNVRPGEVTYGDLFQVLPFGNRGVIVEPMPAEKLIALLTRSIQTCGSYGALMQSGLRVTYYRDCAGTNGTIDPNAKLLKVETSEGETILDYVQGIVPASGRVFRVATLDFLAAGGSGYDGFKGTPITADLGIVREAMVDEFLARPFVWDGKIDGRWVETNALPVTDRERGWIRPMDPDCAGH